eukprot:TRINITY_DN67362_c10_g3_i1.p1 TRINITY_DN67362_c10_g3~~TRINITY_DN67362_c10_g3_i1.p1  ORF type:complete len:458 (+),score=122.92 TRINITY_DN67362_c10_g3_i1:107-1375(+)
MMMMRIHQQQQQRSLDQQQQRSSSATGTRRTPAPGGGGGGGESVVVVSNNGSSIVGGGSSAASPSSSSSSMMSVGSAEQQYREMMKFKDDENLPMFVRKRRAKNFRRMMRKAGLSDTWVHQIAEHKAREVRERNEDLARAKEYLSWSLKEEHKDTEKKKMVKQQAYLIGKENEAMARNRANYQHENPHIQPMGYLFSHHEELHALPPDLNFLKTQIDSKKAAEQYEKDREQARDRAIGERQAREFRDLVEAEIQKKKDTQRKVAEAYDDQLRVTSTFTVLPGRYIDAEEPLNSSGNYFFNKKTYSPTQLAQEERREKIDKRLKLREMIRKNMEEDVKMKEMNKAAIKAAELEDRRKVEYLRNLAIEQEQQERLVKKAQKVEMKKAWDAQCEEKAATSKVERDAERSFQESAYFRNDSSDDEL